MDHIVVLLAHCLLYSSNHILCFGFTHSDSRASDTTLGTCRWHWRQNSWIHALTRNYFQSFFSIIFLRGVSPPVWCSGDHVVLRIQGSWMQSMCFNPLSYFSGPILRFLKMNTCWSEALINKKRCLQLGMFRDHISDALCGSLFLRAFQNTPGWTHTQAWVLREFSFQMCHLGAVFIRMTIVILSELWEHCYHWPLQTAQE